MTPQISAAAVDLCSKGGTVVITEMAPFDEPALVLPTAMRTMLSKSIRGTMYGDCSPTRDIPALLALHREKKLLLEELITRRYRLEQVNEGYRDLEAGILLRGLVEIA